MLLFYLFYYAVSNVAILFICILNIFYDSGINAYIHTYIHTYHTIPYHTIPYHTIPYHTIHTYIHTYIWQGLSTDLFMLNRKARFCYGKIYISLASTSYFQVVQENDK